jgi:predicted RNA-binding Zn-ribbon protein involved in translation (DUF1610 family)
MRYTTAGYGDEATFPPCTGHPLDPRTEEAEQACPQCGSTDLLEIDMGLMCAECGAVFDA